MEQIKQEYKWYRSWWAIILFIFLTIFLILSVTFAFLVRDYVKKINSQEITGPGLVKALENQTKYSKTEGINNYWIGSVNPKVTIVQFGDFSCPICGETYEKIRKISIEYKNDVKFIFRDYPISDNSVSLSMAARCAGEQGKFWEMHDRLFQNQNKFEVTNKNLINMATSLGVEKNKFQKCLTEQKYMKDIQKDFADGEIFGVSGTPTWFINGYKVQGNIPYDSFTKLIDALIQYGTN